MSEIISRVYKLISSAAMQYRFALVSLLHLAHVFLANLLAFSLRFEIAIPTNHADTMFTYLPYLVLIRFVMYYRARLYRDLWRYTSTGNLVKIVSSVTLGSLIFFVLVRFGFQDYSYPRSVYIIDWMLMIMFAGGTRMFVRVLREYQMPGKSGQRVLIIGAGDAGEMIARDMKNNPNSPYVPIGFIDDDIYKKGLDIHGIPILGSMDKLEGIVRQYEPDEFLISIPSARDRVIRRLYENLRDFNLPVKTLPMVSDMTHGDLSVAQIKPLSMEDLLQREPVLGDLAVVSDFIRGKVVLVTGAGGSIGSELCRQIFQYNPTTLIMLDRYENGLYDVDLELRGMDSKGVELHCVIADMLDAARIENVFSTHSPHVVFHAAAHKHVPLMESNPLEAVKNNVFGTRTLMQSAIRNNVESFVLISTDKAVNPTNIMGSTKRIAEFMALSLNVEGNTKFTVVRFGNVLGSNGSVFHVFKSQIDNGGPVTVTHPEIKRFFMLIPEAVQLVLQAASYGQGGEIFVLDMGEPIRIADFAENIIRLLGYVPHEDIEIVYTGLRPGEKLFEELFDSSEKRLSTSSDKLMMALTPLPTRAHLDAFIEELAAIVDRQSEEDLFNAIDQLVSGYQRDQGGSC